MNTFRATIGAVIFTLALFASASASALTLSSPADGELVLPGQTVWLIIDPSTPDEVSIRAINVLAPGAQGCGNMQPALPIQCQLIIPDGADDSPMPSAIDIRVSVFLENGNERRLSAHLKIAPTKALIALRGDPREPTLIFDSIGEKKTLAVWGLYADGIDRDLREQAKGTGYSVSDSTVASVREDGTVIATGTGETSITVTNSTLSFEVPVIVLDRQRNANSIKD